MKTLSQPAVPLDPDRKQRLDPYIRAIAYAPTTDIVPAAQQREFERALRDIARLQARAQVRAGVAARFSRAPQTPKAAPRPRQHGRRPRRRAERALPTAPDGPRSSPCPLRDDGRGYCTRCDLFHVCPDTDPCPWCPISADDRRRVPRPGVPHNSREALAFRAHKRTIRSVQRGGR